MSKVAIRVSSTEPAVLKALKDATGRSLGELVACVRSRKAAAEFLLFGNDHEEVAGRLRVLIARLVESGEGVEIFQMERNESLDKISDETACEMSPEILERVLIQHEEGLRRFKRIDSQ